MGLKCHKTLWNFKECCPILPKLWKSACFFCFAFKNTNFAHMLKTFGQTCPWVRQWEQRRGEEEGGGQLAPYKGAGCHPVQPVADVEGRGVEVWEAGGGEVERGMIGWHHAKSSLSLSPGTISPVGAVPPRAGCLPQPGTWEPEPEKSVQTYDPGSAIIITGLIYTRDTQCQVSALHP